MWRIESARIIAGLTRLVRDVGVAEKPAQEALVAALEQWPGRVAPVELHAGMLLQHESRACTH